MSYFQATAGIGGVDTIGFHFGTATAAGSPFQFIGNGNLIASADMRAPIFYDSNNTAFYVNPNGQSNISSATIGYNGSTYAYEAAATGKLYFGSSTGDSSTNYHITTNMENFGGNYSKLDVRWYTGQRFFADSGYGGFRFYQIDTGALIFSINSGGNFAQAANSLRAPIFYDSNDTAYYVDPTSYFVLIKGRVGPTAGSQSGNTSALEIMNNGGTGDSNLANITFHCTGQYGTSLHLRPDGYFGVGGWSASTWRWYTYLGNGDMTAAGNVTAYSDPRLKTDITPIQSALSIIQQLNGVRFKWIESSIIGHPGEYDYGVLADQVQKVLPELVADSMHEAPEGDKYKTVAYDKFAPILIEAVKELTKYSTALEQRISQLEARL
jgi:hypothetical protein